MFRPRRRHGERNMQGVMLLAFQLLSVGIENIPPITLAVIGICTALYLGVLPMFDFRLSTVCISLLTVAPSLVSGGGLSGSSQSFFSKPSLLDSMFGGGGLTGLFASSAQKLRMSNFGGGIMRFIASPFYHADDMHLYYNMVSWMFKARSIELSLGSEYMVLLLLVSLLLTNVAYLALSYVALLYVSSGIGPFSDLIIQWLGPGHCAVGLSGVIFFLKTWLVIEPAASNLGDAAHQGNMGTIWIPGLPFPIGLNMLNNMFGFRTNRKHAVWFELIIIQVFVPNVSFTAHLAGIVAAYGFHKLNVHSWMVRRSREINQMIRDFFPPAR